MPEKEGTELADPPYQAQRWGGGKKKACTLPTASCGEGGVTRSIGEPGVIRLMGDDFGAVSVGLRKPPGDDEKHTHRAF